ncbi:hypothetical protein EGH22_06130 [Halomicroarcula sp. F28]|uniref:Uncharacterized protein n=1 Tax=Haloarcula salinisoli TaxID=2487746 RepID=A0A8J7YFW9_9EURY|nr:hypothetical protein [Halomicroarcula salinisoli]MBX0302611.1 hypothetical protein [Halomicroarcula salinisoli]
MTDTAATVLLIVGVAALLVPALFPVQQVLYHETRSGTTSNGSELREQGYTVIGYENLSERGQEIYVAALESRGEYTVPAGQGAPEFPYDGADELGDVNRSEEPAVRQRLTSVVIERPDDADLPPPDEPVDRIRAEPPQREGAAAGGPETATRGEEAAQQLEQRRQVVGKYDLMTVRKGTPPATDSGTLLRLGSVLLGTVSVGLGGYLRSRP